MIYGLSDWLDGDVLEVNRRFDVKVSWVGGGELRPRPRPRLRLRGRLRLRAVLWLWGGASAEGMLNESLFAHDFSISYPSKTMAQSSFKKEPTPSHPDVTAIMAEIRERVKSEVAAAKDSPKAFRGKPADFAAGATRRAGELLHSEELRYLNQHYAAVFGPRLRMEQVTSHRAGIIGRAIVSLKRKILAVVWDHLLKDWVHEQREYQVNLLRFLNDSSKYIDARDAGNFWELIKKIDYDITGALERIERIADASSASVRASERELADTLARELKSLRDGVAELRTTAAQHGDSLRALDSVARGLEGIVSSLGRPFEAKDASVAAIPDQSYLLLENRYRGSEQLIASRLSIYPQMFPKIADKPICEIGGGRGELQQLFKESGIRSYSVDIDRAMAEASVAKQLDARFGDGIEHLASLEDDSLAGVIAIQVVEHLNRQQLEHLFSLCAQRVAPGGVVVFETIDPRSILALSSNYFRDPTHVQPLHPDTLSYMLTLYGFEIVEVRSLSEVPNEAQLKLIEIEEYMTPRWGHLIDTINNNIQQLNRLLYGHQDFCVVAKRRQ